METIDSFGYWVRRRRKALDLTQGELAQRVGCAVVTLRKIEGDERRPSLAMAQRLAKCLMLPAAESPRFIATALGEQATVRLPLPPGPVSSKAPGNLPAPMTSLVGRSAEIAALTSSLHRPNLRLLTLTGPMGVGKTRLAIEVGRRLLGDYPHGVYLVALAAVQDPALAPSATAAALGVRETRDQNLEQALVDFLADKEMLLIFDNFEHLLPAAAFLHALLTACPSLRLLVTSRCRLPLYGEHQFVVKPLSLPAAPEQASAADAPAVRLFCERAQAARADFRLTPALTPIVVEMCRRLDGLPLAIELAAARIRLFSVQELQQRLDEHRLPLLTQDVTDLAPRLQALETAMDWSYELLSAPERTLLARLAVFVGSFSLAAAEGVCAAPLLPPADPGILARPGMINQIETLLAQSLLVRQGAEAESDFAQRKPCSRCPRRLLCEATEGESRFAMLETIREYALDRLEAKGELAIMQQGHAEYFAAWAGQAEAQLHGPDQVVWLARLEQEMGNLRAALGWLLTAGQVIKAADMACALRVFWQRHGHYSEGLNWLRQTLEQMTEQAVPDTLRARTLQATAALAYRQGDWQRSRQWLMESLALFKAASDQPGMTRVLFELGWIAVDQADWAEAARFNEESLLLAREAGDPCAVYQALTNLGWTQMCIGQQDTAAALFDEAYALAQRVGHTKGVAVSLANLGWIALYQGDAVRAATLAQESLRLCHLLGERELLAECLEILAVTAVEAGEISRAVQLGGAAEAAWEALHLTRPRAQDAAWPYSQAIETMHQQLAEADFESAWRQGRAMNPEALVGFALNCRGARVAPQRVSARP